MLIFRILNFSWILLYFFVNGSLAFATLPPESQFPAKADAKKNQLDPSLKKWFKYCADVPNLMDRKPKELKKYFGHEDPVIKNLMKIRFTHFISSKKHRGKIAKEVLKEMKSILDKLDMHKGNGLVAPYIFEEILVNESVAKKDKEFIAGALRKHGGNSCPHKALLLKDLDREQAPPMSITEAEDFITKIGKFRSDSFKEEALEELLEILPDEYQARLSAKLKPHVLPFPKLLDDNDWILGASKAADEMKSKTMEMANRFEKVTEVLRRKRCNTARSYFLRGLKKDVEKKHLLKTEAMAIKVENCYRRKGTAARLRFWRSIKRQLKKAYGFAGEEIALRRIGLIRWSKDNFKEARRIFDRILEQAKNEKNLRIEARTLFTFARIAENQSQLEDSTRYYEKYIKKFPSDPGVDEALTSLTLLYTVKKKYLKALKISNQLIERQTLRAIDARANSALAFALFWSGRISYKLNKIAQAKEMFRRVATEYYSTFYGALGHYALEKIEGKILVLQPAISKGFKTTNLYANYSEEERVAVDRIIALLKLGMKEEASCEISELTYKSDENKKILSASILLYAAGDWLEAIKKFSNLPRSFRHSLPMGMERLLFPRAYTQEVQEYSRKLGLDAAYIFAIIRQESVFNPKALSPVGARGLMQLMPRTARAEARRLRRGYVSRQQRRNIITNSLYRNKLYDAKLNLALGVHHVHTLMKRYRSPVFVLTSYNASPTATEKWRRNIPTDDILAFIERIPYKETKSYVKLVIRNYFYYKRWYNVEALKLDIMDNLLADVFLRKVNP